ncbi:sugar nucleotide-binding protein [Patescibacteria group bacterium]
MKILIIGASSYVGARIYFDFKGKYELIGTYFNNPLSKKFIKLDLTDRKSVKKLISEQKPDVIIHVANYPNARSAVGNEKRYIALNRDATETLVKEANLVNSKLVFISGQAALVTDNIYGKLKAESEKIVKQVKAGYLILRPRLIIGFSPNTINDRTFNKLLKCIDGKVKVVEFDSSWKFQPTYIGHLFQMIDQVIKSSRWNLTLPVLVNKITTQYELAKDVLGKFNIKVKEVDLKLTFPTINDDLTEFNKFDLKPRTYEEMISTIVEEIKNRNKFKIQ